MTGARRAAPTAARAARRHRLSRKPFLFQTSSRAAQQRTRRATLRMVHTALHVDAHAPAAPYSRRPRRFICVHAEVSALRPSPRRHGERRSSAKTARENPGVGGVDPRAVELGTRLLLRRAAHLARSRVLGIEVLKRAHRARVRLEAGASITAAQRRAAHLAIGGAREVDEGAGAARRRSRGGLRRARGRGRARRPPRRRRSRRRRRARTPARPTRSTSSSTRRASGPRPKTASSSRRPTSGCGSTKRAPASSPRSTRTGARAAPPATRRAPRAA